MERIDAMATATVTFRMEVLREHASARKAVVSQEAEVAESTVQLASLDEFIQQLRSRLDEVERHFGQGRVFAPTAESFRQVSRMSGSRWWRALRSPRSSIRPISSWTGTFPMRACSIPEVGSEVLCCSATGGFPERSPKSCRFPVCTPGRSRQLLARDRPATQIARIRFDPDASPPPLNSTVDVHMHYTGLSARIADGSGPFLGALLNMTPRMSRGVPHDAD